MIPVESGTWFGKQLPHFHPLLLFQKNGPQKGMGERYERVCCTLLLLNLADSFGALQQKCAKQKDSFF